jgi:hypothetical protein
MTTGSHSSTPPAWLRDADRGHRVDTPQTSVPAELTTLSAREVENERAMRFLRQVSTTSRFCLLGTSIVWFCFS